MRNSVENQSEWCLIHVSNKSRYSVVLELLAIFVSPDSVSQLWNEYSIISNNRSFYLHNWNVIVWWNQLSLTQSLFSIDTVVWFKKCSDSMKLYWRTTSSRQVLFFASTLWCHFLYIILLLIKWRHNVLARNWLYGSK